MQIANFKLLVFVFDSPFFVIIRYPHVFYTEPGTLNF